MTDQFSGLDTRANHTRKIVHTCDLQHACCAHENDWVSNEIKFQNASKRQIKIIYFYVIKTPLYKIITGDSQTHIILNLGLGRRLVYTCCLPKECLTH